MTTPHADAFAKAARKFTDLARIHDAIGADEGIEYRDAARLLREWADIPVDETWTVTDAHEPAPTEPEPYDLHICAYQLRKTHIGHRVRVDPDEQDFRSRGWAPGILRSFRGQRGSDDMRMTIEREDGNHYVVVIPRVSLMIVEDLIDKPDTP